MLCVRPYDMYIYIYRIKKGGVFRRITPVEIKGALEDA